MTQHSTAFEVERPVPAGDALENLLRDKNAAGVSERVRKGCEEVMKHDWQAARAWFKDALNRDPENAGLKAE